MTGYLPFCLPPWFFVPHNVKDLQAISFGSETLHLVSENHGPLRVFRYQVLNPLMP